ncbi:MAG: S9 family peptidase [Chloroflexi bacterium]|nr:S9 family peptidase [Chloroflexota bacterium]
MDGAGLRRASRRSGANRAGRGRDQPVARRRSRHRLRRGSGSRRGLPLARRRWPGDPGLAVSRARRGVRHDRLCPRRADLASGRSLRPDRAVFAGQGFNVLAPNYRGSTGFSRAYQEAIKVEGWGGVEQGDIRAGIEALIAAGIAQRGRVGITGTSYGGYSSWCAITRYSTDLIAAAAPICGMTDLVADYELTRPELRPYSAEMMGGTPDDVPERFAERSPVHHVANIRGRLLIVQGEQDPNVTPEQVTIVRQALDAVGIPYEVLLFPDEGHGIHRRPNQRTLLLRLLSFFQQSMRT